MPLPNDLDIINIMRDLNLWFENNGMSDPALVIRLKDQETGLRFAACVERLMKTINPKIRWSSQISYVDIWGTRFVWPMQEKDSPDAD